MYFSLSFIIGGSKTEVNLPSFVDPSNMMHYHLNEKGFHKVKKIMCVIGHTNPDITFGPGIFPLASLLLHYLDEEDCYNCLYTLLRSRDNYLAQTKIAYEAAKFVLKDLAKKHAVSILLKLCFIYLYQVTQLVLYIYAE